MSLQELAVEARSGCYIVMTQWKRSIVDSQTKQLKPEKKHEIENILKVPGLFCYTGNMIMTF